MSTRFRIEIETTTVFEVDAEELKAEYPDEWREFCERTGYEEGDWREWVRDCYDAGGPAVFGEPFDVMADVQIDGLS